MQKILITGSSGLIGSECAAFYAQRGWKVYGLDNNMRGNLFGPQGDTRSVKKTLEDRFPHCVFSEIDVRNREDVQQAVRDIRPHAVIHTAAQPSHDLAASRPFDDFDINAAGTFNLLEACRQTVSESPFVFLSTNKVYGDGPNRLPFVELETRWDFKDRRDAPGIKETMSVDSVMHSLFGASKLAADVFVQEFGRYFGMPTCCLRCGCVTGPNQRGVELHGFLSYLIKCNVLQTPYRIFGFKGKQVRDNIHSWDIASFSQEFIRNPRAAEVYNIGGGRPNSLSILEAFELIESISGKKMIYEYIESERKGDHRCYISDLSKIRKDFPGWEVTKDLSTIIEEIFLSWRGKG